MSFGIHSRHLMTFEFCQRGAPVDTLFLTVLKTWTSSFEHSMIIHVHVRFEFPEVSAACLTSRSLNLSILCLVVDQGLVVLFFREEGGLLAIPTTHRLRPCAIGHKWWPIDTLFGRSDIFSGRELSTCISRYFCTRCDSW